MSTEQQLKIENPILNEREIKLSKIKKQLDEFNNNIKCFSEEEMSKVQEALDLMIEVHINQKDRPDGMPYVSHPLEIANDVLTKYAKDKNLVIAALMHDSVEDQSYLLSLKHLGQYNQDEWQDLLESREKAEEEYSTELREIALMEINDRFGSRVMDIVKGLSNPDFEALIEMLKNKGIDKNKNILYKEHVQEAIKNDDICVIKYADFARNALKIDNLEEGKRKDYLRMKYGPVIQEIFLPKFSSLDSGHPLYSKKEVLIDELNLYYRQNY